MSTPHVKAVVNAITYYRLGVGGGEAGGVFVLGADGDGAGPGVLGGAGGAGVDVGCAGVLVGIVGLAILGFVLHSCSALK